MTRARAAFLLLALAAASAYAIEPEACLGEAGAEPAVTVEHEGRTYAFAAAECRELFLSDPERYGQLFDALEELRSSPDTETETDRRSRSLRAAEGAASEPVSLVAN